MAIEEHLAALRAGATPWNEWRLSNQSITPDLRDANLDYADLRERNMSGADLRGCSLVGSDMRGSNLSHINPFGPGLEVLGRILKPLKLQSANLHDTDWIHADLTGADLSNADLSKATMRDANLAKSTLRNANLRGADLGGCIFSETNLAGADFNCARIGWARFENVDLSDVVALEHVKHDGPSSIDIATIFKSGGAIAPAFLRGVGVPEAFVTYTGSLVGTGIEFYSCFISYSSTDQRFANRLYSDLRAKNLRCWFASSDLKIGERFQDRIEESIRLFDKVMIVLSEASVESRWVEREVLAAREREERENRIVLFPIRIDNAVMSASQPWAADIRRSRHIGNFQEWESDHLYTKAFDRLLKDLQIKPQVPS